MVSHASTAWWREGISRRRWFGMRQEQEDTHSCLTPTVQHCAGGLEAILIPRYAWLCICVCIYVMCV